MKSFVKWVLILVLINTLFSLINLNEIRAENRVLSTYANLLVFSLLIGGVLAFIETYGLPRENKKADQILVNAFKARRLKPNLYVFHIGDYELFVQKNLRMIFSSRFSMSSKMEQIVFYIPTNKIKKPAYHRWFPFTTEIIEGEEMYTLIKTHRYGLALAKSRLEAFFNGVIEE